ncbi:MAG: SpoIIE family protein phosphatase [Spirochaetes bacterium]|nr:SpoIIE family protein phosphatase [Spirochaetota bacterium]MBX3722385.1 SpoIIE family protein phosphatase [Turneriella sp.]
MRRLFLPLFYFVANTLSFGAAAASSALYAGILTFVFILYYSYAIKLPAMDELLIVVSAAAILTTVVHGAWFGVFHKLRFSGITRSMRNMNRGIVRGSTWFKIDIRQNLNADEYRLLHRQLCYLPRENAFMSVAMVLVIISAVTFYLIRWQNYPLINLIQVEVIALIAGFIHSGFTAVITELVTGEMRTRVKQIMYEKKVEFTEIALSTVRSKILFFILIMVATLFVSNFMVYYNVEFSVMIRFSVFAIFVAATMAYMLFSIVLQSLREIEATSKSIKEGKDAMLFPQALDDEFINVATGLNTATTTIRDYQHNLERKVEERTLELTQANDALHAKDKLIQMELDFASEIQKGIIPARIEEWNGLKFFGYYKPMEKVSGDYYDVFPTHGNRLGVLMADVSGHGVPAALITTMAKVAFARAAQNTHSPAQTFREVNDQLIDIVTTQDYLTAFYLTIDETHHFYFGNASHQHAKIIRAEDLSVESLDTDGLFVGAMLEASDSYGEKEARLFAGDRLFLYTDGLIEIRNKDDQEFGNQRFDALLVAAKDLPGDKAVPFIIDEVFRFAEGNKPNDDISILMIEVNREYSRFLQIAARAYQKIEQGDKQTGAKLLDEAIKLYGKNLLSLKTAGALNFDLGRVEVAERYFKAYADISRQNAEVFFYLSSIAILKKNFELAEEFAREAINLRSNYAVAFNNLSIACLNLGKFALARFAIEKALSFEPENDEMKKNAARLEEILNKNQ